MEFSFTLPDDREFDVVGFGLNAVGHLVPTSRFPSFNTKVRLTDHRQMSGGQISSAMVGAELMVRKPKRGHNPGMIGRLKARWRSVSRVLSDLLF
jgi:hypothetical protein